MPFKRTVVCLALVLAAGSVRAARQESPSDWRYTALDLEVALVPERGEMTLRGTGEIEALAPVSEIRLRVNGNWNTLRFDSASIDGAAADINVTDPAHKAWRSAVVRLTQPARAGQRMKVRFALAKEQDAFPLAVKKNVAVAISDAVWYPVPPDGSMAVPPGTVSFRMPAAWHVAPMGELKSTQKDGLQVIETFAMPQNRRRAFIAAPYRVHQTTGATGSNVLYLLESPVDQATLLAAFDRARRGLEAKYGPLPFRDYRIAEMPNDAVPWYGASEEGLIISRNEMMRTADGLIGNLVHELAHSWWGNKVLPSGPGGVLLNEGMASFTGMAFAESTESRERVIESSEFGSASGSPDATIYGYVQLWRAGKDAPIAQLKSGVGDHYNIAQTKGVWVLRMLEDRIGSDRFYGALRKLVAEKPTLTVADFRQAMIAAAPADQNLPQFLSQWLDQTGIPELGVRWRNEMRGDQPTAVLSVFQQQPGTPYSLSVDVKLRTRKGVVMTRMELDGVESHLAVPVPGDVVGVEIDPAHKLLLWRREFADSRGQQ